MSVLIIEGVTGAGKTSTIEALKSVATFELIDEQATLNDFVTEFFANPDAAASLARERMTAILDRIESTSRSERYLIERFHFSQLALGSEWKWYCGINRRCAALECRVVVLVIPDPAIAERSLYREEYGGNDWQKLIEHYGSEENALRQLRRAQAARLEAIEESRLEYLELETGEKTWKRYAVEIAAWSGWA